MLNKRPDGQLAHDVPPYRRIMPYLMKGANESSVYFDLELDVSKTGAFIDEFNRKHGNTPISIFHVVLWGCVQVINERPRLNRFVAGGRLWERDGIWITYSAKKRKDDDAPVVMVKRRFDPDQPFEEMVEQYYSQLGENRSKKKSRVDKELHGLLKLPGPGLRALMRVSKLADALGLFPKSFIDGDPMYASAVIANLGSLRMDAAYHHLYEYGNVPIFCVIGRTKETPVAENGKVKSKPMTILRFTYDERIEDGLYAQRSLQLLQQIVEDPVEAGILE